MPPAGVLLPTQDPTQSTPRLTCQGGPAPGAAAGQPSRTTRAHGWPSSRTSYCFTCQGWAPPSRTVGTVLALPLFILEAASPPPPSSPSCILVRENSSTVTAASSGQIPGPKCPHQGCQ